MKYSEFEKEIKDWAMTYGIPIDYIQYDYSEIIIENEVNGDVIARIDWNIQYYFHMGWTGAKYLGEPARRDLFELLVEISETPTDERLEDKKYYLRHRFIKSLSEQTYLAKGAKYFWIMNKMRTDADCQQFTLDEIEEIKEKYDTDLKDFELIEVTNEPRRI